MQRARRRVLGLNIVLAAAASAILIAIVFGAQVFSLHTNQAADAAFDVGLTQMKMNSAFTSLLEAESSQRGYLLTRDETYLEPFITARSHIQQDIDDAERQFSKLALDKNVKPLGQIGSVATRKFAELDQTIALARQGKVDEALAIVRGNLGRDLMTHARDTIADQQSALVSLRDERVADLRDSAHKLIMLTTLGVFSVVALSLLALLQMSHQTRKLHRAQDELETANDELEERVRERTRDLQRANDEIQRYAYIVSHDLRAPLVNIVGFTRELETASEAIKSAFEAMPPGPRQPVVAEAVRAIEQDVPEALHFIQSSTGRMDNLINAILNLSRLGRLTLYPREIELNALVGDCIASIQHRATEADALVVIEGALPRLIGDRNALEQVLGNVLDNAVKYLAADRPGRIVISGKRRGTFVMIAVEDNGRGVAPADQERIFELFRRAGRQDRPGEGIGLAHVRSLVRRMGGDISVESDGISGSTFKITLPYDLRQVISRGSSDAPN